MKLIKIQEGLLEAENYFLYSPASDFLGEHQYRRDNTSFTLVEGTIERRLDREQYVIVVNKNSSPVGSVEAVHFYVRENINKLGITETSIGNNVSTPWYKLVRYNNMLQAYYSLDGIEWTNLGGWNITNQVVQGFAIEKQPGSDLELQILDYKMYRTPYITIGGLYDGECVVLRDGETVVDRKIADERGVVDLFIHNNFAATVDVYTSATQQTLLHTENIDAVMGDEYMAGEQNLVFYYRQENLTFSPTLLKESVATITAHNIGDMTAEDIQIGIDYTGEHFITMSLDGSEYNSYIMLTLQPDEQRDFYIKIKRNYNAPITARLQDFGLVVHS